MKISQLIVVICAGALLACGQKGPLVMPDAQKHKRTIPSLPGTANPPAPAPASPAPAPASPAPATTLPAAAPAPTSGSPSTPAPTDPTSHP